VGERGGRAPQRGGQGFTNCVNKGAFFHANGGYDLAGGFVDKKRGRRRLKKGATSVLARKKKRPSSFPQYYAQKCGHTGGGVRVSEAKGGRARVFLLNNTKKEW